ncbi:MAG TPA: 2Fe-2S iron-sulfur cluster-binding protein [Nevskia sp.]|jgi:2Fe-2S ferredoxin|nr:2Fe-2S iron-sulfur cluster-binding protein [Nevskia sp.]
MAVEVLVTDRNGNGHALETSGARPLMEVLREANLEVEGTCGGACACGTCHVYVGAAWADRLPPRSEDEQMMLDAIADLVEVRPNSRLSCQIPMSEALNGITVEIGPVP